MSYAEQIAAGGVTCRHCGLTFPLGLSNHECRGPFKRVDESAPETRAYAPRDDGFPPICTVDRKTGRVLDDFSKDPVLDRIDAISRESEPAPAAFESAFETQVGGEHYKAMGDYQPWEVLKHWLTPEEYRGYMKGTAIAYLARERAKGGTQDIAKAAHTLDALVEVQP